MSTDETSMSPYTPNLSSGSEPVLMQRDESIDGIVESTKNLAIASTAMLQSMNRMQDELAKTKQNVDRLVERLDAHDDELERFKQSAPLIPTHKREIHKRVNNRIYSLLGLKKVRGKLSPESRASRYVYGGLFYAGIYGDLNARFNVSEYAEIRDIDFDEAKSFVDTWEPSDGIDELKSQAEEAWSMKNPGINVNEFLGRLF